MEKEGILKKEEFKMIFSELEKENTNEIDELLNNITKNTTRKEN